MGGQVNNHNFGGDGVNIVKDPLQMGDSEASQLQNAELVPDQTLGGQGSLSKRGGLIALTSALAGSILGMISLPLQTIYTRTLVLGQGTEDSDTFLQSTDGTNFTQLSTPLRPARTENKYKDPLSGQTVLNNCSRRGASYKQQVFYVGDDYTVGTTNPPIDSWDGTNAVEMFRIPIGQNSDGTPPIAVTDMLAANGKIYFCLVELEASASAFHAGRVMEFNPQTNTLRQVANAIGPQTGEVDDDDGIPSCLAWYQGKLWMGLHASNSGVADVGAVYWCYPDVDTSWTVDVSNLNSKPNSLVEFKGNLIAACSYSDGNGDIIRRLSSTGAWTNVSSQATTDFMMLRVNTFNNKVYCVRFSDSGAGDTEIMESSDGATWASVRDVQTDDAGGVEVRPVGAIQYGDDLFYAFESVNYADDDNDGFILRLRSGTWSKVYTGNVSGPMMVLLTRS